MVLSIMWVGLVASAMLIEAWKGNIDVLWFLTLTFIAALVPVGSLVAGRVTRWVIRGFIS